MEGKLEAKWALRFKVGDIVHLLDHEALYFLYYVKEINFESECYIVNKGLLYFEDQDKFELYTGEVREDFLEEVEAFRLGELIKSIDYELYM